MSDPVHTLKILFAGTSQFAAEHLAALLDDGRRVVGVFTQPDRPGKRGHQLQPSPVKEVALAADLPLFQPARLGPRSLAEAAALAPDVMVVVAYGHRLSAAMLDMPRLGCINIHASLLPRWRGAAPIQRALLAGDTETGVTVMRMDEGWDTGAILLQRSCPIVPTDTAQSLEARLCALGRDALIAALDALDAGVLEARTQGDEGATYARKIDKEEALIDWSASAAEIERAVRAFQPSPVAYTWFDALRVRIWQTRVSSTRVVNGAPGEILSVGRDGIEVCCGEGVLRLERLQLPLGKGTVLPIEAILNARSDLLVPGSRFSAHPPGNVSP